MLLPAYSPELQPAEHLWSLVHEALANQRIETLDELEDLLVDRCRSLAADTRPIQSHTLFNWWPIDYGV